MPLFRLPCQIWVTVPEAWTLLIVAAIVPAGTGICPCPHGVLDRNESCPTYEKVNVAQSTPFVVVN